jgi:hypothetical protein
LRGARERLTSWDERLKKLLASIPIETQRESLSQTIGYPTLRQIAGNPSAPLQSRLRRPLRRGMPLFLALAQLFQHCEHAHQQSLTPGGSDSKIA